MTEYDFNNFSDFSADFNGVEQSASPETPTVSIVVVDADTAVRDYLASLFDNSIQAASTPEAQQLSVSEPALVVMGPSSATPEEFAAMEVWSKGNPAIGSMLVTTELSIELLHEALRVGIDDVIEAPIDEALLSETVERLSRGLVGTQQADETLAPASATPFDNSMFDPEQMGRVISVFSTKGGSGKSITAANLAILLAQSSDKPVVLIDGHLQFGDQEVMLKLNAKHTVVDAIEQIEKADPAFMQKLMTEHEATGLLVLPAPREPTFADQITGSQFQHMIKLCQMFAGHVVVDLPAFFNDTVISTLEHSHDIVLVAGLDIPNIKNVKIGLRTLSMLGIGEERIQLVLNRADSKVKLDIGEVERTLGSSKAIHVPSDVVVPISVNKGSPVVLSATKSGVARSFQELASRFVGEVQSSTASSAGRRKFFG